jgi:hypothetical protein
MSKNKRAGGKFCESHTTCITTAAKVADIAHACPHVTKINLGFITAGLRSAGGHRRVKIVDDGKSLLLGVRDSTSHQELRIYVSDLPAAKLAIVTGIRAKGIKVEFKDVPH